MQFIRIILVIALFAFISCQLPNFQRAVELNRMGLEFAANGNSKLAIQYYEAACRIKGVPDSNRCDYLANIGLEYWFNNVDSATNYYAEAAQLSNPLSYKWLYYKANIYILHNKTDTALNLLLRAYHLDSVNMLANNLLGLIYLGDYGNSYCNPQEALKYNKQSYSVYKDVQSSFVLARNYYMINMMENAEVLFEGICKKAPENTPYLKTLIMVEQEMGNQQKSDSLLQQLKQKDIARYNQVIEANIKAGQHTIVWNRN